MKTLVVTDSKKYSAAVVRALSPNAAVDLANELYDLPLLKEPTVTPLADLPEAELRSVLQTAVWSVKGFIPTVSVWKVTEGLSAQQTRESLESLAVWVAGSHGPHPWLRPRTPYDDRAELEVHHWVDQSGLDDDTRFPDRKMRMELWRAVRREVENRYETARVGGLPVPDQFVMPQALVIYNGERRPLFTRLQQRKADGEHLEIDQGTVKRLIETEGRSLFEVALLFGVSVKDICELVPQEKPRRGRAKSPELIPKEVSDRFEQLVYEVNLGTVENDLRTKELPEMYLIPVTQRTSTFFSIYMRNRGLSVSKAFESMVAEMVAIQDMILHQLGPNSGWRPGEAAMMELARKWSPLEGNRSAMECEELLNEIEEAVGTLRNSAVDETGRERYARLLRACSDALKASTEEITD